MDRNEELRLAARLGQEARIFLGSGAYQASVESRIVATRESILALPPTSEAWHSLKGYYDALVEVRAALEGMAEEGLRAAHEYETGGTPPETTRRML